jgi:hypothetical protein
MKIEVELNRFLGEENGDQMKIFLLYNLMENQGRTLSSMSISVDNSSLINITRLVSIINHNFRLI